MFKAAGADITNHSWPEPTEIIQSDREGAGVVKFNGNSIRHNDFTEYSQSDHATHGMEVARSSSRAKDMSSAVLKKVEPFGRRSSTALSAIVCSRCPRANMERYWVYFTSTYGLRGAIPIVAVIDSPPTSSIKRLQLETEDLPPPLPNPKASKI
eukprot:4515299-Amphidinium_carterae.1